MRTIVLKLISYLDNHIYIHKLAFIPDEIIR